MTTKRYVATLAVLNVDDTEGTPFMRIWAECKLCSEIVSDHNYDARLGNVSAQIGEEHAEADWLAMQGHWAKMHPGELIAVNLQAGR